MRLPDYKSWFRVPDYGQYELFLIRALFALVIWDVMPESITIPTKAVDVGLGHWINFGFLADPQNLAVCRWVIAACLIHYVGGYLIPFVLPVILFFLIGAGTIGASYGAATHSKQIVVLCLFAQCAMWIYMAFQRKGYGIDSQRKGVFAGAQAIAAAYVISGISKLFGDGNWLVDSVKNFQIQATKNQRMKYYNSLREQTAETATGLQGWLASMFSPVLNTIEHLLLTSPVWRGLFLGGGFMLELFAFVALIGRKMSLLVGSSLILFHLTVFEIMGLKFRYNIYLLLIFLVGVPYWGEALYRRIRKSGCAGD